LTLDKRVIVKSPRRMVGTCRAIYPRISAKRTRNETGKTELTIYC
jgi:hypothetical protein